MRSAVPISLSTITAVGLYFTAMSLFADAPINEKADSSPASSFNGINWADRRDNFVDGWIIPSGIDDRAQPADITMQARSILTKFKFLLGVNTIRLGINPATVLDEKWWSKYRMIIREATSQKLKVILTCWESRDSRDGKIDNQQEFDRMWDQVLTDFADSGDVYFEIFNEPHGYSDAKWQDLAAGWIERQSKKIEGGDRTRILVSGSGYNERLTGVARDKRFDGCSLSFHLYAWFGGKHKTVEGWSREIGQRIGKPNADRTIVTEWGAPMKTRPQDFYAKRLPDGDRERVYVVAMSNIIRKWDMGSIYWPGLKGGDDYSLTARKEGSSALKITNESGKAQLQWSFKRD